MSAPENATNLAPRKRLRAAPPASWHVARTTDHAGQPAHAVWFGSSSSSSSPPPPPPDATSFQIYTTSSLAADPDAAALSAVRLLIGSSGPDELPALRTGTTASSTSTPRIDVYAGVSDVLACVEHQRREIRMRSGSAARIPGFAASSYEKPRGLAVVLTAEVQAEEVEESVLEEPGREREDGPVFVWFHRAGGAKVRVPADLEVEEGGELALERIEVEAVRIRAWGAVEGEMRRVMVEEVDEEDVDFKDDEGAERARKEEEHEKAQGAATLPEAQLIISSEINAAGDCYIIVDNFPGTTAPSNNPDLQYLIYDLSGNDDLTAVAHSFTSSLLSHLPPTTAVRLEFHPSPTLTASIERCRLEQRARPDLRFGYLTNNSDPHCRIFPSSPLIEAAIDKHRAHIPGGGAHLSGFSVFLVALEKREWGNEGGVLFVRADPDFGGLKRLMGRESDDEDVNVGKAVELLVGRPPGIAAVAGRSAGWL